MWPLIHRGPLEGGFGVYSLFQYSFCWLWVGVIRWLCKERVGRYALSVKSIFIFGVSWLLEMFFNDLARHAPSIESHCLTVLYYYIHQIIGKVG